MPSTEDTQWIKSTANDLNNLLQVISESAQALEKHLVGNAEAGRYLDILRSSVERACDTAGTMVKRGGGELQSQDNPKTFTPRVVEAAPQASSKFKIGNPNGHRELILMVD